MRAMSEANREKGWDEGDGGSGGLGEGVKFETISVCIGSIGFIFILPFCHRPPLFILQP